LRQPARRVARELYLIRGSAGTPTRDPPGDTGPMCCAVHEGFSGPDLSSPSELRHTCESSPDSRCPSQRPITVISMPACSRCIASECRTTRRDIMRCLCSGYVFAAIWAASSSRSATDVRVNEPPMRLGSKGRSDPRAFSSCNHRLICFAVLGHGGTCRSLRPLPRMRTAALGPSDRSTTPRWICSDPGVSDVGRKSENFAVYVHTLFTPTLYTPVHERVTKVMDARVGMSSAGTPTKLAAHKLEGVLRAASPRRPAMIEEEEGVYCGARRILVAPAGIALQSASRAGCRGTGRDFPNLACWISSMPPLRLASWRRRVVASETRSPAADQ
jgi:hypothetical protein